MILDFIKNFVFTIAGCAALLWATVFVVESALAGFESIVNSLCATTKVGKYFFEFVISYDDFKEYIADREGKVQDLAEVVRCKDCKHYDPFRIPGATSGLCHKNNIMGIKETDFCSYAERRAHDGENH